MAEKVSMTITIDRDLQKSLDETCKALHMSRSAYISGVLSTVEQGNAAGFLMDAWKSAKKGKRKRKETTVTGDDPLVIL